MRFNDRSAARDTGYCGHCVGKDTESGGSQRVLDQSGAEEPQITDFSC